METATEDSIMAMFDIQDMHGTVTPATMPPGACLSPSPGPDPFGAAFAPSPVWDRASPPSQLEDMPMPGFAPSAMPPFNPSPSPSPSPPSNMGMSVFNPSPLPLPSGAFAPPLATAAPPTLVNNSVVDSPAPAAALPRPATAPVAALPRPATAPAAATPAATQSVPMTPPSRNCFEPIKQSAVHASGSADSLVQQQRASTAKNELRRQRNKEHARKSRERARAYNASLEAQIKQLTVRNVHLEAHTQRLAASVEQWRTTIQASLAQHAAKRRRVAGLPAEQPAQPSAAPAQPSAAPAQPALTAPAQPALTAPAPPALAAPAMPAT